jgi:hypothetical protein
MTGWLQRLLQKKQGESREVAGVKKEVKDGLSQNMIEVAVKSMRRGVKFYLPRKQGKRMQYQ